MNFMQKNYVEFITKNKDINKKMKEINLEQWINKYNPIFIEEELKDFDLFRNELQYYENNNIWTEIYCENEDFYIIPGLHIVNKFRIFITEISWLPEDELILQVNDNEMISDLDAAKHCYEFAQSINIQLSINDLSDFFHLNKDETFENEMTTGRAKYLAIEFIEKTINDDLSDEHQDLIHNFYSQL